MNVKSWLKKAIAIVLTIGMLSCFSVAFAQDNNITNKCSDLDVKIKELTIKKIESDLEKVEQDKKINELTYDMALKESIAKGIRAEGDSIHLYLEYIDYSSLWKNLQYVKIRSPKKLVIHLFSFGGSVFDALAMAGLIEDVKRNGTIVEVRAKGLAASAGIIILVSGSTGYRYIDRNAMAMFHELQSFTFLKVETPTSKEEEAKILRKIQNNINAYISAHSKFSLTDLQSRIDKKELWLDAKEVIEFGLADHIE